MSTHGLAFTLALLIVAPASSPAIAAQLRFEPDIAYLGSLSTLDPLESQWSADGVAVGIESSDDWRLEVRMSGAMRRTADGLALPADRGRGATGSEPSPIFDLQPHVIMSGHGTRAASEIQREWHELARALERYLDRGDPPGTYEGTLQGRLLDASDHPISGYVSLSFHFDIAPWVRILDDDVPDFSVQLVDGALEGVSPSAAVRLVSNSSWTLSVARAEQSTSRVGSDGFDPARLSASALPDGQAGWTLLNPGYVALEREPRPFVAGDAPRPFTVVNAEIPFVIRYRASSFLPAGLYGEGLRFMARTGRSCP